MPTLLLLLVLCAACTQQPPASFSPAAKAVSVATDRAALVAFYHATKGDYWRRNDNWLSNAPLGDWFGVETNDQGRVIRLGPCCLDVGGGFLPPELGNLSELIELTLDDNSLSGPIPPQLGNLSQLRWLDLSNNQLTGSIPPELGTLENLQGLSLFQNQLTGSLPRELGNLSQLEYLDIWENMLSGPIPAELGALNLKSVRIGRNLLTGCIPESWREAYDFRLKAYQEQNGRIGFLDFCSGGETLPEEDNTNVATDRAALVALYHATSGDNWIINDNWLSNAPLDSWAGVDTDSQGRVETLWMTGNRLRGRIPTQLGRMEKLKWLRLNLNELTGPIPASLGNLTNLYSLLLSDNELTGPIPASLGRLPKLQTLSLSDNELTGPIPASLGNLSDLIILNMHNNQLTGLIPASLGQLPKLREVRVRGNRFTGCLPAEWSDLYDFNTDFDEVGLAFCATSSTGEFNIEIVFVDDKLTRSQQDLVRRAVGRWQEIIIGDLPNIRFSAKNPYFRWLPSPMSKLIKVETPVDDMRLFVGVAAPEAMGELVMGTGGPFLYRDATSLPVLSALVLNPSYLEEWMPEQTLASLIRHEIGHCLGFGVLWEPLGLYSDAGGPHFTGTKALQWFNLSGGEDYRGAKVPTQEGSGHWNADVFGDELMIQGWAYPYDSPLSIVTLASMADLGYTVDWNAADYYRVPSSAAAKPQAPPIEGHCQILREEIQFVAEDGRVVR